MEEDDYKTFHKAWEEASKMQKKNPLASLEDFSSCVRCEYLGEYGTHGSCEACYNTKVKGGGQPRCVSTKTYINGCENFEWNGFPVNAEAYRASKEKFPESKLNTLPEKAAMDITFEECRKAYDYGMCFKHHKEEFEQEHGRIK